MLARTGLIETRLGRGLTHGFQHPRDAEGGELSRENGLVPRGLHEALRGEIIDLVGLRFVDDVGERRLIEQIGRDEFDAIDKMGNALVRGGRRAADDADNAIPLGEQQFGEVRAVLSGDPGDQCSL